MMDTSSGKRTSAPTSTWSVSSIANRDKYALAQPGVETVHPCWLRLWWNTSYTLNPIRHPVASSMNVGIAPRAVR
jgi:hypothetical protein